MARYTRDVSVRNSKKSVYTNHEDVYVHGNTVHKPQSVPQRRERIQPDQPKTSRQVRRNRRRALGMSPGYVIFLASAAIIGLFACIQFLGIRSEMTTRSKNITQLKKELVTLKEENTTKYNAIMDSVNLDDVRARAIEQLGMVYAQPDQIIEYENPAGDFVKQYEDIPEDGILTAGGTVSK